MARSTYIYIITNKASGAILSAGTVKRDVLWFAYCDDYNSDECNLFRIRDSGDGLTLMDLDSEIIAEIKAREGS